MRRLIPIIVLVLACVVPTAAQANHSDSPPHLSCGEIDGTFSDFPSGPQTVTLHTAVDGVPQPDQNITANGPDFTTSTGYWNPDAGSHVVQGWFTWTTSEGETGRGPLQTTTITNCPPQGAACDDRAADDEQHHPAGHTIGDRAEQLERQRTEQLERQRTEHVRRRGR